KAGLLKDIEEVEDLKLVSLKHHKQTLISLREYGLQYRDAQSKVLSDLTFEVKQGDRIVFSGRNGCGKSTLIKAILEKAGYETGQMSNLMEQGELSVASGLRISYINQDTSFLKGSIKEFCRNENLDESLFCALLRKLDMERVQFTKKLEAYSQGQKKKVLIAASLLTPAHLYIWDEPLNYIDVFSRMQIEKLLLSYQPTMILVEHDKTFAQKVRTKIVEF
ncbi:MAG: ABC-F family ATP-binding cassette domain-containing protein, partial [Lachnospiraceae bacterium]|nr:ABC-F family ATP-binding cassette domain-containing protein [Lachnospiraceae bacterium]